MGRTLILYGTTEGHSAKVSRHMAEALRDQGHAVEVQDIAEAPADFRPEGFGGVIIGTSVHMGRHNRAVTEFARTHRESLGSGPSAFSWVSMSAAGGREDDRVLAQSYVDAFLQETGWAPDMTDLVAGALTMGTEGPGGDGGSPPP